jgi:hypothetical protein
MKKIKEGQREIKRSGGNHGKGKDWCNLRCHSQEKARLPMSMKWENEGDWEEMGSEIQPRGNHKTKISSGIFHFHSVITEYIYIAKIRAKIFC